MAQYLAGVAVLIMGAISSYTGSLAAPIAVGITVWGAYCHGW